MKMAIIGAGPRGIEMALHLNSLGAQVLLFDGAGKMGGPFVKLVSHFPEMKVGKTWEEVTSKEGRELVAELPERSQITLRDYWDSYLEKIINSLTVQKMLYSFKVERVQKRFLAPGELPIEKSRFADLFRVVYLHKLSLEEREKIEAQLGNKVAENLEEELERYCDVDGVIDARGSFNSPRPVGPGGDFAINESLVKRKGQIYYGLDALDSGLEGLEEVKKITIVGSGQVAAWLIEKLGPWFKNKDKEILLITNEANPFGSWEAENKGSAELEKINSFIKQEELKWREEAELKEDEIRAWRTLPDFERAKIPCPKIPEPKLKILSHANITSLDSLIDQEGIFVTCEDTPLRGGKGYLATFQTERVFAATGHCELPCIASGLDLLRPDSDGHRHNEVGYYSFCPRTSGYSLKNGLNQVQWVGLDLMNFFSRA
jgi:hypothetical protein